MGRAVFFIAASVFLGSCATVSDTSDTAKPLAVTLTSITVVHHPALLAEPELRQSQGPRFLISFSSREELGRLAADLHLAIRAHTYRCRSADDAGAVEDGTSMDAWEAQVYDRSGTLMDEPADTQNSTGDYHLYVDVNWWDVTPVQNALWHRPENLCVRVVGLSDNGAVRASSGVVLISKDQLDALSPQLGESPRFDLSAR